jgi:hypothetical protein
MDSNRRIQPVFCREGFRRLVAVEGLEERSVPAMVYSDFVADFSGESGELRSAGSPQSMFGDFVAVGAGRLRVVFEFRTTLEELRDRMKLTLSSKHPMSPGTQDRTLPRST